MKNLLKKFEEKPPEIVFEWKDQETDAEGWVVINSLRNGAAGGGTRMRKGL
ncbi:MAG: amino acid dehydrogenase, partial [Bacteroidetes bacterium]